MNPNLTGEGKGSIPTQDYRLLAVPFFPQSFSTGLNHDSNPYITETNGLGRMNKDFVHDMSVARTGGEIRRLKPATHLAILYAWTAKSPFSPTIREFELHRFCAFRKRQQNALVLRDLKLSFSLVQFSAAWNKAFLPFIAYWAREHTICESALHTGAK